MVVVDGEEYEHFEIKKMKFAAKDDRSTIIFNDFITVRNIPEEAYEYILRGRSAIEWVMKQHQIKVDKASGIVNYPNQWCKSVGIRGTFSTFCWAS